MEVLHNIILQIQRRSHTYVLSCYITFLLLKEGQLLFVVAATTSICRHNPLYRNMRSMNVNASEKCSLRHHRKSFRLPPDCPIIDESRLPFMRTAYESASHSTQSIVEYATLWYLIWFRIFNRYFSQTREQLCYYGSLLLGITRRARLPTPSGYIICISGHFSR